MTHIGNAATSQPEATSRPHCCHMAYAWEDVLQDTAQPACAAGADACVVHPCRREKERLVTLSMCFKRLNGVVGALLWVDATVLRHPSTCAQFLRICISFIPAHPAISVAFWPYMPGLLQSPFDSAAYVCFYAFADQFGGCSGHHSCCSQAACVRPACGESRQSWGGAPSSGLNIGNPQALPAVHMLWWYGLPLHACTELPFQRSPSW